MFQPRIGYTHRQDDANSENYDRERGRIELSAEGRFASRWFYLVRLRQHESDYETLDPGMSNFAREDDRDELWLQFGVAVRESWRVLFGASKLDSVSTRTSRNFDTFGAWTSVRYEF